MSPTDFAGLRGRWAERTLRGIFCLRQKMVVDAVRSELVSVDRRISLLNRENTGKFFDFAPVLLRRTVAYVRIQRHSELNSLKT